MIFSSLHSAAVRSGTVLAGRYEIRREVGRGGQSIVYAAFDRTVGHEVAIKVLAPAPAAARSVVERLRREVELVRGLVHHGIVAVHDYLEENGLGCIVMELVDGPNLADLVRRDGPLETRAAARIADDVAEALAFAHGHGVLHRDVKPQNILLDPTGRARLTDFGSARREGLGTVSWTATFVGTVAYAAPEVFAGRRGDARADLYALGLTLFLGLTGRLPERSSPHLPPAPRPEGFHPRGTRPDVPEWLDALVARATAALPGHRFPSATALREALEHEGLPAIAAEGEAPQRCFLCGETDVLGMGICTHCAGDGKDADTLLVVREPVHPDEAGAALASLLRTHPSRPLAEAARGRRPLLRIPHDGAAGVTDQLARHGIAVESMARRHGWSFVPTSLYALAAAVLAVGLAVGLTRDPMFLWSAPLVAGLLLVGAQRHLIIPAVQAGPRSTALPADLETDLITCLRRLPSGAARSVLGDIIRIAQSAARRLEADGAPAQVLEPLYAVLRGASEAASDLADLDEHLARFDRQQERFDPLPPTWLDGMAAVEQARDRVVQSLLDALTALGEVRGKWAGRPDSAAARLAESAEALRSQAALRADAMAEVEAFLQPTVAGQAGGSSLGGGP